MIRNLPGKSGLISIGLVLILVLGGCANSLYVDADLYDERPYQEKVFYEDVPVFDVVDDGAGKFFWYKGVKTNLILKERIVETLKSYRVIVKAALIKEIRLVSVMAMERNSRYLSGAYSYNVIWLATNGRKVDDVIGTLYHEIGHAIEDYLKYEQIRDWDDVYRAELKEMGVEKPLGDKYIFAPSSMWHLFPSQYCLFSFSEYFAEHVEAYRTLSEYSKRYLVQHALIIKHGIDKLDGETARNRVCFKETHRFDEED